MINVYVVLVSLCLDAVDDVVRYRSSGVLKLRQKSKELMVDVRGLTQQNSADCI